MLCLCHSKRDAASPVHRQARQQAHGYLKQLKERATKHADDEGEMFLDSLGQMKKASKGELFGNAVTHRCYAFWMLGVFTDHYMRCYSDAGSAQSWRRMPSGYGARCSCGPSATTRICSAASSSAHSRMQGQRRAKASYKVGFEGLVLFRSVPLHGHSEPQLLHFFFGSWAWPTY